MNQYPTFHSYDPGQGTPPTQWSAPHQGYTQGVAPGYAPPAYPPQPTAYQPQPAYPAYPAYPAQPVQVPAQAGYAQPGYLPPQPYPQQPVYYAPAYPVSYPPPFALRQEKNPAVKSASGTLNRLCLVMLMQTLVGVAVSYALMMFSVFQFHDVLSSDMGFQWLNTVLVPLSTALPFLIYLKIGRKDVTDYLRFEKVGFFTALLCVLAGLAICLLGNYPAFAIQDFFSQFGYEPSSVITQSGKQTVPLFILELLTTAVLVPVMEEFAFRGVLLSALRKHGAGFAITASALVFAFAHGDFSNVVFAFIAGLVFGFLYVRTGNLWVSICIHALNNGIAVVESYSGFLFGESMEYAVQDITMIVPIALGIIALILLFVFRRNALAKKEQEGAPALSAGGSAAAIVRTPLFWVLFSFVVFYTANLFF